MRSEIYDRPVFICGHPTSGTSLLRGILDAHPQLVTYPEETGFFRRYLPKSQGRPLEEKLDLSDQYLTHIFEWNTSSPPPHQAGFPDRDYSHLSAESIRGVQRRMLEEGCRQDGDVLSAAVLAYGEVSGRLSEGSRRWVEKTPYNENFAGQIFAWWPEALCLHMVRDPRDNYVSYRRKHPDWSPETFARSWRRSTRAGIENQAKYGEKRYLIIRYEDFTSDPEGTISQVCSFLGIDDDPSLRNPTRGGQPWQGNSMFGDRFRGIGHSGVGRWHVSLPVRDCFVIETLASPAMRDMHYERTTTSKTHVPPIVRLDTYKTLISISLKEKFK